MLAQELVFLVRIGEGCEGTRPLRLSSRLCEWVPTSFSLLYIGTHSHVLLDKLWPAVRTCSPEIITETLIDSHNCWCLFPSRIDQWISNVSGGCVRTGVNDIDPHLNQHVTAAIFFHNPVFFCCRYMSGSKGIDSVNTSINPRLILFIKLADTRRKDTPPI